jgi:hypothetical protein
VRRHRAALCIQAAVRGMLQRRTYLKIRCATILLQRRLRWTLESKKMAQDYVRLKGRRHRKSLEIVKGYGILVPVLLNSLDTFNYLYYL